MVELRILWDCFNIICVYPWNLVQLYLCLTLFFRVRTSDDDSFTSEEAKKFICGLENHFYEIFNIKLGVSKEIQTSYTVTFCCCCDKHCQHCGLAYCCCDKHCQHCGLAYCCCDKHCQHCSLAYCCCDKHCQHCSSCMYVIVLD